MLIQLLKYVKIKVPVFVIWWAMRFINFLLIYLLYCYIYILLKKPQLLLEKSQFYPMKMAWSSIGYLQLVMKWPQNLSSIGCLGAKLMANQTNVSVSQSKGELYLLETMTGHNIWLFINISFLVSWIWYHQRIFGLWEMQEIWNK